MMAGSKLDNVPFDPVTLKEVEDFLTKRLLRELYIKAVIPVRLIKSQ